MNNISPVTGFVLRSNASQGFRKCFLVAFAVMAGWHFSKAYYDYRAELRYLSSKPMVTFDTIAKLKCDQILEVDTRKETIYTCYVRKEFDK